jgi:carbamoyltransferase
MIVLGINGGLKRAFDDDAVANYCHDSSAALINDGELIAAIEEERLDRIKHSNCFPLNSIRYCLELGKTTLRDIDLIVVNNTESALAHWQSQQSLRNPALPMEEDPISQITRIILQEFQIDAREKIEFCHHHLAHAWSAYALAGFSRALVVTLDGIGDGSAGMIFSAVDRTLTQIHDISPQNSLGLLYLDIISLLGLGNFDEFKAMGLAPYGNPNRYKSLFRERIQLFSNGGFEIDHRDKWLTTFASAGLIRHARRKGQEFTQVHADLAAALQTALEEVALHVIRHHKMTTGESNLCLAGGVAHNSVLTGRIISEKLFDSVFVQPASSDAGGAIGAACASHSRDNPTKPFKTMTHVYLGKGIGGNIEIEQELAKWGSFVNSTLENDIASVAACHLAAGRVVGWMQGRSEFGPRALGSRSIVADPRPHSNKQRINEMVKKREGFRPFAPSVLEEAASEFFDIPSGQFDLSFMTYVVPVKAEARNLLGAITHVDGTARIQTVSKVISPKFWSLIHSFGQITSVPLLLNTSFNNNAEPIVDSVRDAIVCYLTTGLDILVVGDYVITKKSEDGIMSSFRNLIPQIPEWVRIEKAFRGSEAGKTGWTCFLRSVKRTVHVVRQTEISIEAFDVLSSCNGTMSLEELLDLSGVDDFDKLISEIYSLWRERWLFLSPG